MDGYHIALFIHFCALIGAVAVAATVHLASVRRGRAKTVSDMLEWHNLIMGAAKGFPIALVTLVASGSYMIRGGALQIWSSGFVVAGLTGVVLLLAVGTVLSIRGRVLKQSLDQWVNAGGGSQSPSAPPDSLTEILQNVPLGIVFAVVFDMTTKPSLASALSVIGLGIAVGAAAGILFRPAPATSKVAAE